jgi:hypothetical protein
MPSSIAVAHALKPTSTDTAPRLAQAAVVAAI